MFAEQFGKDDLGALQSFFQSERKKVLSDAEFRFRMRGYGYRLKSVDGGVLVARMSQNRILGRIQL